MTIERDPFGREYRAGRLSDEETAERMLQTAVAKVNRDGLRISFDLLRFEDLIAEAGVARSAAYRRWPTKHHFYADLLRELAGNVHPATAAYDASTVELALRLLGENTEQLRTPAGRHRLTVELCRMGALRNSDTLYESGAWAIYITLTATLVSLPEGGELRADLQRGLEGSGDGFLVKMAAFYDAMMHFLGRRIRVDMPGVSVEVLTQLGAAIIGGLSLDAMAAPDKSEQRFVIDPFGTGNVAEWTLASLGFTLIAVTLTEPDPALAEEWDDERIAGVRTELEALMASAPES